VALATSSPDEAGAKYGNTRKQASAPWTYAVKLTGKVIAADTGSRAATIDVDADGDGKADAKVQIGPADARHCAARHAGIRQFQRVQEPDRVGAIRQGVQREDQYQPLASLPRDGLTGKTVTVTGAFPLPASGQPPLVTPAEITVGPYMAEQIEHDVILRLDDVSKVYSGIVAVKRADLELRRGAVNVLVGENGAGKSTLMKIIAGVERPTLGRIVLDGETVSFDSPADAQAHGIG
jgi:ABC-type glutathione transport system ATPase component